VSIIKPACKSLTTTHWRLFSSADAYCGMVTVLIGPDEDDFSFDQESLILRSAYFRNLLDGRGYERVVKERVIDHSETLADTLIRLRFLGDFLGDIKLQNPISDELATWYIDRQVESYVSEATIAFVGEHTESPTATGFVDRACFKNFPIHQFCVDWADCYFDNVDP